MVEILARLLRSGKLKQGAVGFAAKAQSFSVELKSCEIRIDRASMKALGFGSEAESSPLQFCGISVRAQIPAPRQ
jgi:hypothetical protein